LGEKSTTTAKKIGIDIIGSILYTPNMTDKNTGTMIEFTNDEQRKVFQLKMALNVLESEVINTMGIRFYRGSIVNVLKRYFPDLPRTRRSAYKYLKQKGFYQKR